MKPASNAAHRSDIDALRAVAVGLVVLFHMSFPGFSAGFVGVDIFFVLSGFLITGVLIRELDTTGSIDILNFWSRRIRRLLPAGLVVVASVLVFSRLFGSPLAWSETSGTAASAVLYYSNYYFSAQASDYFAADTDTNPLLHFWSLSVEEQYYLVWPVLFVGLGALLARTKRFSLHQVVVGLSSTVIAASFVHSFAISAAGSGGAYYLTTSRAWEFASGALLAAAVHRRTNSASAAARSGVALAGLGLLAACLVAIDFAPFPTPGALLPVAGTLLFVWAAVPQDSPLGSLMNLGPLQYVGRLSYSWYLWHWPFLVLGQQYLMSTTPPTRMLLVVASFGAAVVTHHAVENPMRYSKLIKSKGRSYAFAAASIVVGIGGALALGQAADSKLAEPELAALQALRDPWYAEPTQDFACAISDIAELQERCTFGATNSTKRLLLLGDSNAEHWLPAFHALGLEHDFAVTLRVRGGCPAPAINARGTIDPDKCADLQAQTGAFVTELDPDLVIISQTGKYAELALNDEGSNIGAAEREALWVDRTQQLLAELDEYQIGWITPTPSLTSDPVECLATREAADCGAPAYEATLLALQQSAWSSTAFEEADTAPLVLDPLPFLCSDSDCPVVIDGTYVYLDDNHLSAPMAEKLVPEIATFLKRLDFLKEQI